MKGKKLYKFTITVTIVGAKTSVEIEQSAYVLAASREDVEKYARNLAAHFFGPPGEIGVEETEEGFAAPDIGAFWYVESIEEASFIPVPVAGGGQELFVPGKSDC